MLNPPPDASPEPSPGYLNGSNLPAGCCSEVMEPHMECVYPTDSDYDRDEVKAVSYTHLTLPTILLV